LPQKCHSNDLINFCTIYEVQNADNATLFKMWSGIKIREVYATHDFSIGRKCSMLHYLLYSLSTRWIWWKL